MVTYAIRNALRLELSGIRSELYYSVSDRRRRVESTVQADVYWKFRPTISGLLEGSYEDFGYDSNTAQNNTATQAALGLLWDVTAKSTGSAKLGYQWKSYGNQDPTIGTENSGYYTVALGLKHFFTPRTVLGIDISHASQESDFPDNPYFLRTAVDANLSMRLTSKTYARARAGYSYDEYPNEASFVNPFDKNAKVETDVRKETTFSCGVTLGFDVTRWLSLELEYGYGNRDSSFDTFDYEVNQVSLSAKAAF